MFLTEFIFKTHTATIESKNTCLSNSKCDSESFSSGSKNVNSEVNLQSA
jgi:hypothetical protein